MMKVLTHNIQQEREDQRDRSAQLFMWCIVVSTRGGRKLSGSISTARFSPESCELSLW